MAFPRARIADLVKLRCSIYGHTYNPQCTRTGHKVLRAKLRGPALAAYYPPRPVTIKDIARLFPPHLMETYDESQSLREDSIVITKSRGKGPPKKKRTAAESKKFKKRKPTAQAPVTPA